MRARHWGALLGDAKTYIEDDTVRIPTGFDTVDEKLRGGFRPGHMAMVIGRTGVGKTAVATQIAVNVARMGFVVAYASLEMGREEMVVRAISASTGESVEDSEKLLTKGEDPRLLELNTLSVDDSTKPGWDDLTAWVHEVEKTYDHKPALVVVDHLKLMKRQWARGETERVAQLAEDAKVFAKNTNTCLLVLHQVGRSSDGSDKKNHGQLPLTMESAMYGGEQDADYVFGVYRPSLDPALDSAKRKARDKDVFLQVLKNRHGEQHLDGIYLKWHKPSFWFEEVRGERPDYLD